jgi:hypothetical protein
MNGTFESWLVALESRHLSGVRLQEVTRAVRALSAAYVERRGRLAVRGALDTAGKRAAYALYYGPLHYLTVAHIAVELGAHARPVTRLLDLGCGSGACGAAWAGTLGRRPSVLGVDTHPWALAEAAVTYRFFGLDAKLRRGHAARTTVPRSIDAIVAGWLVNELDEPSRRALLARLIGAASSGVSLLIVEPIATRLTPWWREWVRAVESVGGRCDEWRFRALLPPLLRRLDRAAGLRHEELTARSLYVRHG